MFQWFSRNKKKVRRRSLRAEDVRVVGIHHRRGDHLDYERVYSIPHITMAYLGPSMDLYLEKHNNSVLFLYVSDDKEWGEKYLARDRNVVLSLSDNTEPGQATGEDLALLSLCDDMITTRRGSIFFLSPSRGVLYGQDLLSGVEREEYLAPLPGEHSHSGQPGWQAGLTSGPACSLRPPQRRRFRTDAAAGRSIL